MRRAAKAELTGDDTKETATEHWLNIVAVAEMGNPGLISNLKKSQGAFSMIEDFFRTNLRRLLTKEKALALENKIPSLEDLGGKFQDIDEFGLYLHIPFCEQICPYCPYNKEIYNPFLPKIFRIDKSWGFPASGSPSFFFYLLRVTL